MPNTPAQSYLKDFNVDINYSPQVDKKAFADQGAQITVGDMHGNALKLLHFLFRHGVFSGLSPLGYKHFVSLYHKPTETITKSDLDAFNERLKKLKVNSSATIRLLGDDLADRGANDYFTLKIFEKLFDNNVPVEVIISNHTAEFVEAFEKRKPYERDIPFEKYKPDMAAILKQQGISMANLQRFIEKGLVSRKEIDSIFKNKYSPNLKLISYTFDEKAKRVSLFSHAPIGLQNIRYLADQLKVTYNDGSMYALAKTIDNINKVFTSEYVNKNKVHELFSNEAIDAVGKNIPGADKKYPFAYCIWNRSYKGLSRPQKVNDYSVKYIHGHDPDEKTQMGYIYNLDNALGKHPRLHNETYKIHYTHEKQLKTPRKKQNAVNRHWMFASAIARIAAVVAYVIGLFKRLYPTSSSQQTELPAASKDNTATSSKEKLKSSNSYTPLKNQKQKSPNQANKNATIRQTHCLPTCPPKL